MKFQRRHTSKWLCLGSWPIVGGVRVLLSQHRRDSTLMVSIEDDDGGGMCLDPRGSREVAEMLGKVNVTIESIARARREDRVRVEPTGTVGDFEIVNAMRRFGGSFARALAETATHADPTNLVRLKAAFPDFWSQYREMALLQQQAQEEQ